MKPKFIIGIGSQRAGSTLLHKILSECTPIFMHPVKELHYYDTLFHVRNVDVLKSYSKKQLENFKFSNTNPISKRTECFYRTNKMLNERDLSTIDYIDLYRPCILGNDYLGEITPEYMILPEEGIAKMRDDLGIDTKIILIARNPIERFISSVKLLKMYSNSNYDMKNFEHDLMDVIEELPTWVEHQRELNDYKKVLERYNKYFDKILFLCYDDFIRKPEKVRKQLENFLEFSIEQDQYQNILSKRVNSLGETGKVSKEIIKFLEEKFKNELSFLKDYFGEDKCYL